mgnify:CR=1 FL=1
MKPRFGSKAHQAKMVRHNSYAATLRRVNRAWDFPENTCGASRHAVMIAESIKFNGLEIAGCDAEHVAVSILSTVESLWKLRTAEAQHGKVKKR